MIWLTCSQYRLILLTYLTVAVAKLNILIKKKEKS